MLPASFGTILDGVEVRDGLTGRVASRRVACGERALSTFLTGRNNSTSFSVSSLNSCIVSRPGSTLTLDNTGVSMQTVDDSREVRSSVDASSTDSETPYTRYFPGFSNQNVPTSFFLDNWPTACESSPVRSSKTSSST